MYALVLFLQDDVHYIVKASRFWKHNQIIQIKWSDGYKYPAKVMCIHESREFLQELSDSMKGLVPHIHLANYAGTLKFESRTDVEQSNLAIKKETVLEQSNLAVEKESDVEESNLEIEMETDEQSNLAVEKETDVEQSNLEIEKETDGEDHNDDHFLHMDEVLSELDFDSDNSVADPDFDITKELEIENGLSRYDSNICSFEIMDTFGDAEEEEHCYSKSSGFLTPEDDYRKSNCDESFPVEISVMEPQVSECSRTIEENDPPVIEEFVVCHSMSAENLVEERITQEYNEVNAAMDNPDLPLQPNEPNDMAAVNLNVRDFMEENGQDCTVVNMEEVLSNSSETSELITRKTKSAAVGRPLFYDRREVVLPSCSYNVQGVVNNASVDFARGRSTRRFFCIYCKKLYSKFSQHLSVSHKKEVAVRKFLTLPPKSMERLKIIETIRKRGDFVHNTNPEYNTGQLFVARRSHQDFERVAKDYLPCPYCSAFFHKETLRLHVKSCRPPDADRKTRSTVILSRRLLADVHPRANEILKTKVFPVLRDDDCVSVIRYDLLVILLGNNWCGKYPSQHHHDMIRSKIRTIGRLILTARSLDSSITNFASLLTPGKFDIVVQSIRQLGGLDSSFTTYKAPTTVLTLSTICKQAVAVWKTECIKMSDKPALKQADDFMCLFNTAFPAELGRTAIENRVQHQRHKDVQLPSKSDIEKLVAYLRRCRRQWFQEVSSGTCENFAGAWKQLASYTLVSIMVFNRRRPGELERITITDYSKLRSADSIAKSVGNLNGERDIRLAQTYKRFEIRGKLNRTVPVLVNFEIEACINLVIQTRGNAGVSSDNPYVFGLPSSDHQHRYLRAYILLRSYADLCGASNPHLLRGTQLRKQIATECAVRDLSDNVIKDVANFMGHAIDIHDNIYRRPVDSRDIVQMSKILEMVQGGGDSSDDQSDAEEEQLSDGEDFPEQPTPQLSLLELETPELTGSLAVSPRHDAFPDADTTQLPTSKHEDQNLKRKGTRTHVKGLKRICTTKKPWTSNEKEAARLSFHKFIEKNVLPSTSEVCKQLQDTPTLQSRSPTSVRLWLQGELDRKRSRSDTRPNRPGGKQRWSSPMRKTFNHVFSDNLENGTLPSNAECRIVIEQYPEFEHLTIAALKTAVANALKRLQKR